jgi:hypothetical protein
VLIGSGPGLTPAKRASLWQTSRVAFATPQTMLGDITRGACPARRVVCCVFDEAHKLQGSYAYVKILQGLAMANARCRCVGLSATPGTSEAAVVSVLRLLRAGDVAVKTERQRDVRVYIKSKLEVHVVVPLQGAGGFAKPAAPPAAKPAHYPTLGAAAEAAPRVAADKELVYFGKPTAAAAEAAAAAASSSSSSSSSSSPALPPDAVVAYPGARYAHDPLVSEATQVAEVRKPTKSVHRL